MAQYKLGLLRSVLMAAFMALLSSMSHAQEKTWADFVKAAEAEGVVNVHGSAGRASVISQSEAFTKAYPKIKINFDGSPGREIIPRIVRERQSDIFNWDIYVGGGDSPLGGLKPINAFKELKPELVLPEILDDKNWRGGFDAGWMDIEKKYYYAFDLTEESTLSVNWDFVKKGDLTSIPDLMKPQFMGKIVSLDPRTLGDPIFSFQAFDMNFGEKFVTDLYSKQKIVFTSNRRQAAEWLVRGVYPIAIAAPVEDLKTFQEQGLGKNIEIFRVSTGKPVAGSGFGGVGVFDRAPHPNAAKVYVNWLLSKSGQENWKVMARNSRRTDVAPVVPDFLPPDNAINLQAEEFFTRRRAIIELAKQHIPTDASK